MLIKFLKEVVTIIVGKQAEEIVELLNSKKHVNEFNIAKKLDITINQTRNILYKLSDQGLVSSIRKKDKRKGWYTYFWKIEILKSLEFLKATYIKKKEQIENQIKSRETKRFYICEKCNIELTEESALLNNFECNECGEIFTVKNNSKLLNELKKNLLRLEKELELIEQELDKENEKINKQKEKEREKLREEKDELKKVKKEALRKKRLKEGSKKVVNKKIKKKIIKKKPLKKKNIGKKKIKVKPKKKTKKKLVKKKKKKK